MPILSHISWFLYEFLDDTRIGSQIVQINATDKDSGENGKIKYTFQRAREEKSRYRRTRFWIDENTGIVYTNETLLDNKNTIAEFTVIATDSGKPPRYSKAALWIDIRPSEAELMKFSSDKYT